MTSSEVHTPTRPSVQTPEVSIIIVNYETSRYVRRCVDSLLNQDVPMEIIVVDNPSDKDDWRQLVDLPVVLVRNETNVGYGKACNIGARRARAELLCILNPDTIVPPEMLKRWVNSLRRAQSEHNSVGIVAPQLRNENGTVQRSTYRFISPLSYCLYHSALAGVTKKLHKYYRIPGASARAKTPRRVPWVMGSAMLIPRKAWDAVGGFSDAYFLYAEDMDLCYRMWGAGFEVVFDPTVYLVHTQGEPSPEKRLLAIERFFQGLDTFLRLHYSKRTRALVRLTIIADLLLRLLLVLPLNIFSRNATMHQARLQGYRKLLGYFMRNLVN